MESSGKREFQCDLCGYRCNFRQNLRRHRKTHEAKNVHCAHCPYTCRLPQHLRRHLRLVHSFDPEQARGPLFVCGSCSFATGSAKAMGAHCTRLHDDPKPWRCSRCDYRARSRCIVRYHEEQVHERKRPFRCETCGLAVVSRRVLAIHRVLHSPDPTPYRCDRCSYATRFLSNLTKHMIVHTDAKPYECSACDIRFARKANLKMHLSKAHRRQNEAQSPQSMDQDAASSSEPPLRTESIESHPQDQGRPDANLPLKFGQFCSSPDVAAIDALMSQVFPGEIGQAEDAQTRLELDRCLQADALRRPEEGLDRYKSSVDLLGTEVATLLLAVPIEGELGSTSQDSCILDTEQSGYLQEADGTLQTEDFATEFCSRGCKGDCLLHCILAL